MENDLDRDMQGGRLMNVGRPKEPFDAVRLIDLSQIEQQASLSRPGFVGVGGTGERGPQGLVGATGSDAGSQGAQGPQGFQGILGAQGNQGDIGTGAQGNQGLQGFQGAQGNQGFQGAGALYQFEIGPDLDTFSLPFVNAASEIVSTGTTLTIFRGRRAVAGSAGTTTVQLELNGAAVGGAVLSWTSADIAFTLKTVSIALAVVAGDRLSIRLTSAETGGEDVFAETD